MQKVNKLKYIVAKVHLNVSVSKINHYQQVIE